MARTKGAKDKLPHKRKLRKAPSEQLSSTDLKHEIFANEYMVDFDPGAAYLRAGYKVKNEEGAQACGRRLLRNVRVQEIIEAKRIERIEKLEWDAAKTVLRLKLMYLECREAKDYTNAIAALRELGKHFGIYEKHNDQKKTWTREEVEAKKMKLEAMGVDWSRVNFPPSAN